MRNSSTTTTQPTRKATTTKPASVRKQRRDQPAFLAAHNDQLSGPGGQPALTIGIDMGDRAAQYCVLNATGHPLQRGAVAMHRKAMRTLFEKQPRSRIVIEAGSDSPWVSRLLESCGHEVLVANPRRVKAISDDNKKTDKRDPYTLAKLGRATPELLYPIRHRGERAQLDLLSIKVRATLIEVRTKLVNSVRGLVKQFGERVDKTNIDTLNELSVKLLPEALRDSMAPLVLSIAAINQQLEKCDQEIQRITQTYPEVERLTRIYGVGELTALTFTLIIDDAKRFKRSVHVGSYLGLVPRKRESGQSDPQLGITKCGDRMMRWLLINCAQTILRSKGQDSDLRRWGLHYLGMSEAELADKAKLKKNRRRKRIAVVAVARRLAVIMHKILATEVDYDPLYHARMVQAPAAA